MEFISRVPAKIVWGCIFIVASTALLMLSPSASAGWLKGEFEQGGIDLVELGMLVWESRGSLPWFELVPLLGFLAVPAASLFTSVTATPVPGTLWSFIYKLLELAALNFHKSKDKPVDTLGRKYDGKPVDAINDPLNKLTSIALDVGDIVRTPVADRLKKWFKRRL